MVHATMAMPRLTQIVSTVTLFMVTIPMGSIVVLPLHLHGFALISPMIHGTVVHPNLTFALGIHGMGHARTTGDRHSPQCQPQSRGLSPLTYKNHLQHQVPKIISAPPAGDKQA